MTRIRNVGAMRARQGLGSGYETFKDIKAPYFPKPTRFLWESAAIRSSGGTRIFDLGNTTSRYSVFDSRAMDLAISWVSARRQAGRNGGLSGRPG